MGRVDVSLSIKLLHDIFFSSCFCFLQKKESAQKEKKMSRSKVIKPRTSHNQRQSLEPRVSSSSHFDTDVDYPVDDLLDPVQPVVPVVEPDISLVTTREDFAGMRDDASVSSAATRMENQRPNLQNMELFTAERQGKMMMSAFASLYRLVTGDWSVCCPLNPIHPSYKTGSPLAEKLGSKRTTE